MRLRPITSLDVSAASGLLADDAGFVVIADDELMLTRYAHDGSIQRVRLFEGTLPDEPAARKQAKPDLEALVGLPDGSMLALGSGSKESKRDRGVLVRDDRVHPIDLSPLYDELRAHTNRLNVEGAAVFGPELVLLTRRTGKGGHNSLVRLDLREAMHDLGRGRLGKDTLLHVHEVELGAHDGVPFGFGDATPWRNGLLFVAAAEDTDDPVMDGGCVAAQIGWLDGRGLLQWAHAIEPVLKLEGIAVAPDGRIYVVSDADDRTIAAQLYEAQPESVRTTG
jgi:hypothetical protein